MPQEFRLDPQSSQYEVWIDGEQAGEAHFERRGSVAVFDHTFVATKFGGRGVAAQLIQYAMDDLRAGGELRVKPTCPYVVRWFAEHPQYADLLA